MSITQPLPLSGLLRKQPEYLRRSICNVHRRKLPGRLPARAACLRPHANIDPCSGPQEELDALG
ncbi:protein of unknown function [Nocardia cyriacigeorgica GUH-2]|uniref:Uncharacterized protein n=1 Tax=Nocardia cyriacigeorgica (strain GUH-2) TaxID=1127134 RepID=H6R8K0_NOCCG|nr:protein of unknown function [Nocardia cyriacigeorgica GUH-2]